MREEEGQAKLLVAQLAQLGILAVANGRGVHWHVDVCPHLNRSLKIHCFWYSHFMEGLSLGMNPGNSRSQLRLPQKSYVGPQFYVLISELGNQVADGRTYSIDEVIQCVSTWISGVSLEKFLASSSFVDKKRRAMEAVATSLHPELRWEIMGDPSYDLWVYGRGRSCRVRDESCAFFVGQAQVALGSQIGNVKADIEAWLIDHASILSLVSRGIELERHAEVLEIDPARWHWLHVLDRISTPRDILVEISSLVAELARNSVVSQFYCYTSLNSLCFSASSHYPWVGDYPSVRPARFKENTYVLEGAEYGLEDAIERIETVLRASPIEPFFGSASDYEIGIIANSLRRQGSNLCPEIVQREQWSDIWLKKKSRRCRLDSRWFTFFEGVTSLSGECAHVDDIVAIAIRFLEESAELAEIAADTRILK